MIFVAKQPKTPVYEFISELKPENLEKIRSGAPELYFQLGRERDVITDISKELVGLCRTNLQRFALLAESGAFLQKLDRTEEVVIRRLSAYMRKEAYSEQDKLNTAVNIVEVRRVTEEKKTALTDQKLALEDQFEREDGVTLINIFTDEVVDKVKEKTAFLGRKSKKAVYAHVLNFLNGDARNEFPRTDQMVDTLMVSILASEKDERIRSDATVAFLDKQKNPIDVPLQMAWYPPKPRSSQQSI